MKCEKAQRAPPLSLDKRRKKMKSCFHSYHGHQTFQSKINVQTKISGIHRPKAFVISCGISTCNIQLSSSQFPNAYHGSPSDIRSNYYKPNLPQLYLLRYGFPLTHHHLTPDLLYQLPLLSPTVSRSSMREMPPSPTVMTYSVLKSPQHYHQSPMVLRSALM